MIRRSLALAVALLVALGPASPSQALAMSSPGEAGAVAAAAPAGLDTVELRDGGLVRGTIVELRPGERVTMIVAGDGGTRTFAWEEVATTRVGQPVAAPTSAPVEPPSVGVGAVMQGSGALTQGRGRPRLTIEVRGSRPVHLFTPGQGLMVPSTQLTVVRAGTVLRSVCQSPCGQVIDGRDGYPFFFGGDRMPLSRPLYLSDADGEVVAEVRPGRNGLLLGGTLATTYGIMGAVAGGTLLGIDHERFGRPAGIVLATGVGLLVGGIVMLVRGQTRFKVRRR